MDRSVVIQVPPEWLQNVPEETLTLRQIFKMGLTQYKIERALALYREGNGSLGYLAENLGLPKQQLIIAARQQGIEPDFSEEALREELAG